MIGTSTANNGSKKILRIDQPRCALPENTIRSGRSQILWCCRYGGYCKGSASWAAMQRCIPFIDSILGSLPCHAVTLT